MTRGRPVSPRPGTRAGRQLIAADDASGHVPVLVDAVVEALAPRDDALYIDGTFGGGGYSRALLAAAKCRVVAIDRDSSAVRRGLEMARSHHGRLAVIEGNFGDMERLLARVAPAPVAGVALDLGVSSTQLDRAERGFSFRLDGPLDMRMSTAGLDPGIRPRAAGSWSLAAARARAGWPDALRNGRVPRFESSCRGRRRRRCR